MARIFNCPAVSRLQSRFERKRTACHRGSNWKRHLGKSQHNSLIVNPSSSSSSLFRESLILTSDLLPLGHSQVCINKIQDLKEPLASNILAKITIFQINLLSKSFHLFQQINQGVSRLYKLMLERDKYEPDHCLNHFPVASYDQFCRHIFGGITFKRLFLQTEEFDINAATRNNIIFSTLLVSLFPIFLHKRIYLFRNYQSKKARILFGLAWFFIPSNLLGAYFNQLNTRELTMKYQTNREEFLKFLEIGDINLTNPKQQWAEF